MVQGYEDPEVQNLIDLSAIYNIPMLGTCTVNVYENKYLKKNLKILRHKFSLPLQPDVICFILRLFDL